MKKTNKASRTTTEKLVVKPEAVRPLTPEQMTAVAGGWPQTNCISCSCRC